MRKCPAKDRKAFFIKALFSNFIALERNIANCHYFHVDIALYFEKRAET